MTDLYVRLTEAPTLCLQPLFCSACIVDVDSDGDGWVCPSCGTEWSFDDSDGASGTLYAEWSGGELTGEPVGPDDEAAISRRRREIEAAQLGGKP